MKLLFAVFLFIISFFRVDAFDAQGFTLFTIDQNIATFECASTCAINLGDYTNNDQVQLSGEVVGNGTLSLGILVGTNVNVLQNYNVQELLILDENYTLFNKNFYARIPEGAQLVLVFSGQMSSQEFGVSSHTAGFITHITEFIQSNEGLTPYSINLRYGSQLFGMSWTQILYIVFIVFAALLFLLGKGNKQNILYLTLVLFLLVMTKNMYDFGRTYYEGVQSYHLSDTQKTFHHMGDYYDFTHNVREKMGIDDVSDPRGINCSYYSECQSHWPFCYNWRTIFLQPCQNTKDPNEADFILLHKKEIPASFQSKEVLHSQNGSYLLKN
ncbi:hypothetical protein MK079_00845 [Candidatus Gracilibacteria bacterium]|nr:hypothetical protein [Candidatus Gracilibacteria bacterium]